MMVLGRPPLGLWANEGVLMARGRVRRLSSCMRGSSNKPCIVSGIFIPRNSRIVGAKSGAWA